MSISPPLPPAPEAAVFDLDGVITRTAQVHFDAWKRLFDDFLAQYPATAGVDARPFTEPDYRVYVDGKPRSDGVRDFLASRGIALREEGASEPSALPTIGELGARKNALFLEQIERDGVPVDDAAVALVRALRAAGVRVGIATSSRNADAVLSRVGLDGLFDAQVDGEVSAALGLPGKPRPDAFLECLRRLGSPPPARSVVLEDAASGVAAGRAAGFGLVVGVDRGGNGDRLADAGAHWIVRDLRAVTVDELRQRLAQEAPQHPPGAPIGRGEA